MCSDFLLEILCTNIEVHIHHVIYIYVLSLQFDILIIYTYRLGNQIENMNGF